MGQLGPAPTAPAVLSEAGFAGPGGKRGTRLRRREQRPGPGPETSRPRSPPHVLVPPTSREPLQQTGSPALLISAQEQTAVKQQRESLQKVSNFCPPNRVQMGLSERWSQGGNPEPLASLKQHGDIEPGKELTLQIISACSTRRFSPGARITQYLSSSFSPDRGQHSQLLGKAEGTSKNTAMEPRGEAHRRAGARLHANSDLSPNPAGSSHSAPRGRTCRQLSRHLPVLQHRTPSSPAFQRV